jgi:hypothetical protein
MCHSIRFAALALVAVLVLAGASPLRADQIDNPRYKAWASFKKGSSRTLDATIQAGPVQVQTSMQSTLTDVTDDMITVQTQSTSTYAGQTRQSPPHDQTIAAKVDEKELKDDGEESVDAMGKTFKCKVYEASAASMGAANGAKAQGQVKFWTSEGVPGGIVKMTINVPTPGAGEQGSTTTITYLLSAYEAK